MVSFQAILLSLAVQAMLGSSAPVDNVEGLEARDDASILVDSVRIQYCKDKNWSRGCHNPTPPINKCHGVLRDYDNKISSIQNWDTADYRCVWYRDANCEGLQYSNQKDANLADGNGQMNDSISSYICTRK